MSSYRIEKELFPYSLVSFILFKAFNGPITGYSIATHALRERNTQISYGSLYPFLKRMVKDGLLAITMDYRPNGQKLRVKYHITEMGTRLLSKEVKVK